jgi:Replication-relaxation
MTAQQMSVGRSAARDFDVAFRLLTGRDTSGRAQDSLTASGGTTKRISRAKARAIGQRLTDNDRQVLELLSTVHVATGGQIRRLVWGEGSTPSRSARRQLAKLTALRVVARLPHRPGGVRTGHDGYVYLLDVVGQHLTSERIPRRPRQPSVIFIEHMVAVTECYVTLKLLDAGDELDLIHFESEPRCWREYPGPSGARKTLRPDAFAITGVGEWEYRWFLEIDRGTEFPSRLRSKLDNFIIYWQSGKEQAYAPIFPRVLFVAVDDRRREQIVNLLTELAAEHWPLFQVTTAEQFAQTMVAGRDGLSEVES